MPQNSTTPRKLRVTVEFDVTEGPRLRRGTTQELMQLTFGIPVAQKAAALAQSALGLTPQDVRVNVQWGYVWMDSTLRGVPGEILAS